MSSRSNFLDQVITYLFAGLFFFTPLVLWPKTSELFEFNKMMLVYAFIIIITATFTTKFILEKKLMLRRTPLDLALLLFLLSQILSTVFSINPHTSFWGYYSRFHGGLASTITYTITFYLLVQHLLPEDPKQKRFRFSVITLSILSSAILISFYGILEHFGIDKNVWVQDVQSRVFSTLGQPNWLSAYLVAILPFPIILALHNKDQKETLIYAATSLVLFITILFTKSRSGIGATFIVLFLIFLYQIIRTPKSKLKDPKLLSLILTPLLAIILIGSPWNPTPSQFSERLELGGPLLAEIEPYLNKVNLSSQIKPLEIERLPQELQEQVEARSSGKRFGGSDSFEIRKVVWEGAVNLFKRQPLLGTGVETFGYSYYWTRPQAHNYLSEWDFLYNKAHNEYLNFLATTGGFGLGTYLLLILAILLLFIKLLLKEPNNPYLLATTIGFISILITNYFGFSVVPVAIFFFTFPILALAAAEENFTKPFELNFGRQLTKKEIKRRQSDEISWQQYLSLTLTIIIAGYLLVILARHWLADINFTKGKAYASAGYIGESLPLLERSTKLYPQEPNFHGQLAETYAAAASVLDQQITALPATASAELKSQGLARRQEFATKSMEEANLALKLNPWHLNLHKSKAKAELVLATFEPAYYQQALHTLLTALQLAPTDAKILFNIGLLYQQLDQPQEAITTLEKTLQLKDDYHQARISLIELYLTTDQKDKAKLELERLLLDIPDHPLKDALL